MFLAPDGHEIEIAEAAATFLSDTIPIARLHTGRPHDDALSLAAIGAMGWFGLALPEKVGGSGLSAVEHTLFFREVGRQCGPVDILAQSLAALADDDDQLRGDILTGQCRVALAVVDGDFMRLLGVPNADYALLADLESAQLIALSGSAAGRRPSLDPATSMHTLGALPDATVARCHGDYTWQMGQLGTAAMLVGIAEAALDQIVDYAKIRETFGRKIGSYQAVRHPCADMALRVEAARSQLWFAAAAMKEGRADAAVHLDAAKHLANQAAIANADTNIQLHGGIGVTDEHNAHLFLKHALVLARLFGSKRPLLARLLHAKADA